MAAAPVQHEAQQGPRILGYVRTTVVARFALPAFGDEPVRYEEMPVGEIVALLAPNEWERSRLPDFVKKDAFRPTPHVVVEWRGQRRFLPLENVAGEDERGIRALRGGA